MPISDADMNHTAIGHDRALSDGNEPLSFIRSAMKGICATGCESSSAKAWSAGRRPISSVLMAVWLSVLSPRLRRLQRFLRKYRRCWSFHVFAQRQNVRFLFTSVVFCCLLRLILRRLILRSSHSPEQFFRDVVGVVFSTHGNAVPNPPAHGELGVGLRPFDFA